MFHISGPLVVSVILMVVIDLISSPRISMDGSGQPIRPDLLPLTAELPSMTGQELEGKL